MRKFKTVETFIALLRGINVSGKNMISMKDLESSMASLKFTNIRTYIQSGNILFSTMGKDAALLEDTISKKIRSDFGFDVPVVVRNSSELKKIKNENPFLPAKTGQEERLHVTLLKDHPGKELEVKIEKEKYLPDEFIISGREIYLLCPKGYGQTKLTKTFFENKLKTGATTRNWKTICKLLEIASSFHSS